MKKKLVKKEDVLNEILGNEFYVTEEMIIPPSTKDYLREKGIKIIYSSPFILENDENLSEKIKKILKDSYGIKDEDIINKVLDQVRRLI